jgi:hypothetical protein
MPSIAQLTNEVRDPHTQRSLKALFDAIRADDGRLYASATWDAGSIATAAEAVTEVTVTGAALGDFVLVSMSIDVADLTLTAQVTAAGTVTVQLANVTGGAIDLASATVYLCVIPRSPIASRNLTA